MPQATEPMTTPASAGPATRFTSALTISRETAAGIDPRGTSSARKAIRPGPKSANPAACSTLAHQQHPVGDDVEDDGQPDAGARHRQQQHRELQHHPLRQPVGGHAAPRGRQQQGHAERQQDPAQGGVRPGQLEGEPAAGDRLRHDAQEDRRGVEVQHQEAAEPQDRHPAEHRRLRWNGWERLARHRNRRHRDLG
nr:hypothetical protein [Blastococcus sp. TML/M2B]